MTKLSELSFTDFCELVHFLAEREVDYSEEEKEARIFAIGRNFNRFFPNITAEISVVLNNLIADILKEDTTSEENFCKFKELYGDLEFDPSGKSSPDVNYKELPMKSINIVYNAAIEFLEANNWVDTKKHTPNLQIWNAYSLKCLKSIKPVENYNGEKLLYFRTHPQPYITKEELNDVEKKCEWLIGKENTIPMRLLAYIKLKKYDNCQLFLKHFLQRLDLAYNDVDHEYEETTKFIENLKRLG